MCSLSRSFNRVNSRVETSIDEHKQACVEKKGKFACNYFPTGGEKTLKSNWTIGKDLQIWWFNPRDGKCYLQNNSITYNSNEDFCTIKN
ncbi:MULTISPECIES: putative collagen-binding domain-containing protein [Bacillaceae]|uniref:putative collagen-binding domain-containing protein n=1 Tax=Bacillaceae TaxID=186817 RepID=UPI0037BFF123